MNFGLIKDTGQGAMSMERFSRWALVEGATVCFEASKAIVELSNLKTN